MFKPLRIYRHISNLDVDWMCSGYDPKFRAIYRPDHSGVGCKFVGEEPTFAFIPETEFHKWSDVSELYYKELI